MHTHTHTHTHTNTHTHTHMHTHTQTIIYIKSMQMPSSGLGLETHVCIIIVPCIPVIPHIPGVNWTAEHRPHTCDVCSDPHPCPAPHGSLMCACEVLHNTCTRVSGTVHFLDERAVKLTQFNFTAMPQVRISVPGRQRNEVGHLGPN